MIRYENTNTIRTVLEKAVEEYNDRTFLRYEVEKDEICDISFKEFGKLCHKVGVFVNEMRSDKGRPIKVAIFGSASPEYIATFVGVMASGNIALPIDPKIDIAHLIERLEKSDTDILFYDYQHETLINEIKNYIERIKGCYSLQTVPESPCLNDIITNDKYSCKSWSLEGNEYPVSSDDIAIILFTSGTTGISKGVMLTNGSIVGNYLKARSDNNKINEDIFLNILPIHHSFCISSDLIAALVKGAVLAINGSMLQLNRHLKLFEPTEIHVVPMIAKVLYNKIHALSVSEPSLSEEEILYKVYGKNISRITCGGGGLSADLAKKYSKLGIDIGQGYGMTECSPVISNAAFDRPDKVESAGKILENIEARISDEGEIQVRSPFVMKGYYKEPEMTAEVFTEDGWLKTGDIGHIDDEGFIYITGRIKNLIILSNGENIPSEEMESRFTAELLIEEIIIYGENDVLKCEVYPNFEYAEEKNIKDITAAVKEIVKEHNKQLPSYKRIMVVTIREIPFTKTTSNKIIRSEFFNEKKERDNEKIDFKTPETEGQQKLYEICIRCLGHRNFGIDTNLFASGLDSFGSMMLLSGLNDIMGASLTLTELMDNPTIEEICNKIDEKSRASSIDYSKREVYPLTKVQMYFAYVMRGNTTANIPFFFKLGSGISLDKMEDSIRKLFDVHPILKDRIEPGEDQILYNFRNDEREVNIERLSFTKDEWEKKKDNLVIPYTYTKGEDLYHTGLYEVEGDKYLFLDVCHSICDGMTMNILLEDLSKIYLGEELEKADYSFYEYILDEYAREAAGKREEDIETFNELLGGFEIDRSILARKDSYDLVNAHNASIKGNFERLDMDNLRNFCQKTGVSENVLFLSAFAHTISLYASSNDVAITSIHNGRTDGRWSRIAGSLFGTYVFRYKKVENETIEEMLKRNAEQILHTMETHMSSQHADEMFIQYQGDLLDIPQIGGEPAEKIKIQLDSLPFHFMIYSGSDYYRYELRYWENRFDGDMLKVFIGAMEDVILAMMIETDVKRIKSHISNNLYPKHLEISSLELNESLEREIMNDASTEDMIKPYVINDYGRKKPYGAWGRLFIHERMIKEENETLENIYTQGTLHDTGIIARITPDNRIETIEQTGRIIMRETLIGRFFIDLHKIEEVLLTCPDINSARACIQYGDKNLFYVKAVVETSDMDENDVKEFISDKLDEYMIPEIYEIIDTSSS